MRMLLLLLMFQVSYAENCKEAYWGEINYTDFIDGKLQKKTDIFPIEEWSSQSKFDNVLVEKTASLMKQKKPKVKVKVWYFDKKTRDPKKVFVFREKSYELADWAKNRDFYLVKDFPLKKLLKWNERGAFKIEFRLEDESCPHEIKVLDTGA